MTLAEWWHFTLVRVSEFQHFVSNLCEQFVILEMESLSVTLQYCTAIE